MKSKSNQKYLYMILIALIAMAMLSPISFRTVSAAAPIIVTTTADEFGTGTDTGCSLREAIQAINTVGSFGGCPNADGLADTISLPAGTYYLTLTGVYENQNASGDLNILSRMNIIGAGAATTVIDGNSTDRVFFIIWDASVSISNVTIQHGLSTQPGGGIYNYGQLTLNGVRVESNTADFGGGGIYSTYYLGINHPSLTVINSTFYNNHTDSGGSSGGGIANDTGQLSLTDVTFDSNRANNSGGGIWSVSNYATHLFRTKFTANVATLGSGGSIYNTGPMTIDRSIISTGTSGYEGGNIYTGQYGVGGPLLTITDSEISGGMSPSGGGISNDGQLTVVNTSLFNNGASIQGGALYTKETTAVISLDHVTIAHNLTGGGIYNNSWENPVLVNNSILDGGLDAACIGTVSSTSSYNIDSGTSCGLSSTPGLHNYSSTDALLLPNANNGGFSQTMAIPNNSPAVDTANSIGCPATDQRQVVRPIDGNGDGIKGCDIGAFELGAHIYIPMIIK
jgi:CSLREA domain-containing protein